MFSWTESGEFGSSCELARGAPMTSDDSARCLGDTTTECDYNYENHWIGKNFYYHDAVTWICGQKRIAR